MVDSVSRKCAATIWVHSSHFELARLRTYPQHTRAWLPLLRSRPGGVHRHYVVRSPKSDNLSKRFRFPIGDCHLTNRQWQIGNR